MTGGARRGDRRGEVVHRVDHGAFRQKPDQGDGQEEDRHRPDRHHDRVGVAAGTRVTHRLSRRQEVARCRAADPTGPRTKAIHALATAPFDDTVSTAMG